jgi:hypothetical protein
MVLAAIVLEMFLGGGIAFFVSLVLAGLVMAIGNLGQTGAVMAERVTQGIGVVTVLWVLVTIPRRAFKHFLGRG